MESTTSTKETTRGSEVTARLQAASEQIMVRLIGAALEDMRARYDLGRMAHELRYDGNGAYTKWGLPDLARAVGMTAGTLRRYARVSEVIRSAEFESILELRQDRGMPLTWSHIEELSETRSADVRRQRAEEAIFEHLGVRELIARRRVRSESAAKRNGGAMRWHNR